MNQPPHAPEKRRRIFWPALVLFGCCGRAVSEAHLGSATKLLAVAENEQLLSALGHNLLAAKISMCWNSFLTTSRCETRNIIRKQFEKLNEF